MTIIITGGTKGIGESIALTLAKAKHNLILTYVNDDTSALQIKQKLEEYTNVLVLKSDVTKEEEVTKLLDIVISKYGDVDVLINNAGIAIDTTLEDKTVDNFKKILEVNLIGPFLTSKYIGSYMFKNKKGKIINISSTNGIDTYYKESLDYDASKAGLNSLTHNFANMYAPYVTVNAIACGWVDTDMNKDMDIEFKNKQLNKILLNRFANPLEIANVVNYLINDTYINNSIIRVDGGVKND